MDESPKTPGQVPQGIDFGRGRSLCQDCQVQWWYHYFQSAKTIADRQGLPKYGQMKEHENLFSPFPLCFPFKETEPKRQKSSSARQSNMEGQESSTWTTPSTTTEERARSRHEERIRPKRYAHLKDAKETGSPERMPLHSATNRGDGGGVSIGFTGYGSMKSRHHIGPENQSATAR